jgi:hypothetical protein
VVSFVVADAIDRATTKAISGDEIFPKLGRDRRIGLTGWRSEIRQDGLLLDLAFAQGGEVVGYGFFFVESDLAGVGADETFVEDAARELVEVFIFECAQHADADFRGIGDGVELEPALLALLAKFFSEDSHFWLPVCGHNNHRRRFGRTPYLGLLATLLWVIERKL